MFSAEMVEEQLGVRYLAQGISQTSRLQALGFKPSTLQLAITLTT